MFLCQPYKPSHAGRNGGHGIIYNVIVLVWLFLLYLGAFWCLPLPMLIWKVLCQGTSKIAVLGERDLSSSLLPTYRHVWGGWLSLGFYSLYPGSRGPHTGLISYLSLFFPSQWVILRRAHLPLTDLIYTIATKEHWGAGIPMKTYGVLVCWW